MAQDTNDNHLYKCPNCACIFLTQADLQKHMTHFGTTKEQHEYLFNKIHNRLEHGYGEE
jgi:uncharacterized C2H2 Zn-finger protein